MVAPNEDERTPLLAKQSKPGDGGLRAAERADVDDLDFDARFRKWKAAVARKFRRKSHRQAKPSLLITYFDGLGRAQSILDAKRVSAGNEQLQEVTAMSSAEFQQQVEQVKLAISKGVYPKMITTGSSGSYFVRIISEPSPQRQTTSMGTSTPSSPQEPLLTTVAVFKPKDEEPYGNLNPKRQFLRKYLWWAMGRPCLIPNFSYLSEVGASYLDSRLALEMVPRTELVELSSPTFHYAYSDRSAFEKDNVPLPNKIGSYQTFLKGYVNASDFLRRHPWPSRTRSKTLLMRDMDDESQAHKVSRRKERARLRNCGVAIKRLLLCRPSWDDLYPDDEPDLRHPSSRDVDNVGEPSRINGHSSRSSQHDGFYWTPKRMEQFRLQLERLVVLDFLMRNTDRGLDNFMIKHDVEKDEIKIGAIDNSLSFPIKHPNEIRQYPFGWLFLPSDLIGLPFSESTREHLLPILSDPAWWQHTVHGLRKIFQEDPYFDESKFERQMSVLRGQGWNLVQSLQEPDEGPLDLCAREKKLIRQEVQELQVERVEKMEGVKVSLDSDGQVLPLFAVFELPSLLKPSAGKPPIPRTTSGAIETERRPIGMRASESYRKALLQAAGTDMAFEVEQIDKQLAHDSYATMEPPLSSSLPQSTTLLDRMKSDVFREGDQPESNGTTADRNARHQRFASAHDVSTFHRRQRERTAGGSSQAANEGDGILGRTGIEVLEGLDRQRKQKNKLGFFLNRRRSSTISIDAAANGVESNKIAPRTREGSEEAGRVSGDRSWDLSSSIVSDPGARFDGSSRWPRSKSATRPAEGMVGSLYDLHSQGEVLSEEDNRGQASGSSTRPTPREPVRTIESVLQAHQTARKSSDTQENDQDRTDGSSATAFVPHIPHPRVIGRAEMNSRQTHAADSSERTVKVIVEKISSDTKQAWLKWI